jgi:parvulin-like peptidyl-prolyl isomerase
MRFVFSVLFACSLFIGCSSKSATPEPQSAGAAGQLFAGEGDYAGAHILIAYEGAMRAGPEVTRSKEEALEKARGLIARLNDDPGSFEELARTDSDGPSGPNGGSLGSWNKGDMVPEFDAAIEKLDIGGITAEPVETSFGYHVIRRNAIVVPHYGAEAFIVAFAGPQSPPDVERTRDEAAALAEEIKGRLTADTFDELAAEHNDFSDGVMFLGGFVDGDREPIPGMLDLIKGMSIGETSGPIEFPAGFAFFRRPNLDQRSAAHILLAYAGALRAAPEVTRTKEEALAAATTLAAQLAANPDQFDSIARERSDGPTNVNGGNLGVWFKGMMVPEFDLAIDALQVNGITTTPIETEFGYHIIKRLAVPE